MPKIFNTVKHGYNPDEVDSYIKTLEDVINEYKEKDNAIRNAIVNAQIAADNIVKNAEAEGEEIRKKAKKQCSQLAETIGRQEEIVRAFQENYNNLVNKYLIKVNENEFKEIYKQIDEAKKGFSVNENINEQVNKKN